ncbi:hypothetical protein AAW12_16000 [Sphingobacterium sp. Ag1]|uniref:MarR family transcriptional regulator n=1 Tax=Sphingobacterium sp. Ag1 TaxID=1643451 RepID=UPI0006281A37|nr:helix-turn-helix domain-containing protein [Sphingobacterium sp. Ag1]KKO90579.1 hypothetical protein AAW12_16000 [Sphingobacterium sp. Ag1]
MENLTEKEKAIYEAIKAGFLTVDTITVATEMKKASVATLVNSLVKKGLITKSEGGTISLTDPGSQAVGQGEIKPGPDEKENQENGTPVTLKGLTTDAVIMDWPNKNGNLPQTDTRLDPDKPTLIIPYYKGGAVSTELKLALRSWAKHFGDINVVIVGDSEDWFSDHVIHIEHNGHQVIRHCNGCAAPQTEQHPQADSTHKLFSAIALLNIKGPIILSNDDIFLLRDVTMDDIASPKYFGDLKDAAEKKNTRFNEAQLNTAWILDQLGHPTVRYGTHTPVLLDAAKVLEVIETYNATEVGLLFTSLYFNTHTPEGEPSKITGGTEDKILASIYRPDIGQDVLDKVRSERLFMNCNDKGWLSVRTLLRADFSEKSKYEI